jgi:C_GCAxxG_C_C family probable redox protein
LEDLLSFKVINLKSTLLMNGDNNQRIKKTISRRQFAGRSIVAALALGTAGIAGYSILQSEKTRIFLNYHRMGHCAPSVMQTLLDVNDIDDPELVRFAGAMAGGIAGPKMECGAFTAPLMFLGYQKGIPSDINEKLLIIRQAHSYFNEFDHNNGSTICTNIRHRSENGCWKAISGFYNSFMNSLENPVILPSETEESYILLLNAFADNGFHCSHSMLDMLKRDVVLNKELYAVSWPFAGGIALLNRTCGALASGVMALSSSLAKIESSYGRVARMNKLFKEDNSRAMDNGNNEFNRAINSGTELGTWFRKEFGATSCYDICGYNFSLKKDADSYLSGNCINKCRRITEKVAEKVKNITGLA